MSTLLSQRSRVVVAMAAFLALAGCVADVGDGGGYYNNAAAYPGYYEPYGSYYGGWAPGYYVGPYNNHYAHDFHRGAASHAAEIPSIPSSARMNVAHISAPNANGGAHPSGGSSRGR